MSKRQHPVKWRRRKFLTTTAGTLLLGDTRLRGADDATPSALTVAVITQAGGAHLSSYFDSLAQTPEVGRVVVADSSGACFDDARKRLGAKLAAVFPSADALLGDVRPTLALVSMEARHAPHAIDRALTAGCHVLAEKPACVRAEDFEPLVEKASAKGLHLMLALANRLRPAVIEARRIVSEDGIGEVFGVEAHLVADQTRLTRDSYRKQWFSSKERAGGGHLAWLGVHWLDLIFHITGLDVDSVAGFTAVVGGQPIDVEDSAVVSLRLSNGALGTLTSGYYLDRGYHSSIKIWGSRGWLELAAIEQQPLRWYDARRAAGMELRELEFPGPFPGYAPFVRACVRASAGLEAPPLTGAEGLRVLRTIFTFYDAAKSGETRKVRR